MTPPQGSEVCKAGVAYSVTQHDSVRRKDGTVIRSSSSVVICKEESAEKKSASASRDSNELKSLMRKPKGKTKPKETEGGETNHGLLTISDRKKALDYRGAGHVVRGPQGTANYRIMTAAELKGTPKRAAGNPTRATGTPKK